jgi:hypothetical protein
MLAINFTRKQKSFDSSRTYGRKIISALDLWRRLNAIPITSEAAVGY